jgi:hypothetical protein
VTKQIFRALNITLKTITMKTIISSFLVLFVFIFNSCEGPSGDPGPAGPQGVAGPAGAKGDVGAVNIFSTGWIKITKELYASAYVEEDGNYFTGVGMTGTAIDKITQKTLDEGIVLAYNRVVGDEIVYLVPFDYFDGDNHITYSLFLRPQRASISVYFTKPINPKTWFVDEEFRIIVIPAASGARLKSIDWKNYDEVIKAFDIPEN